MCDMTAEVIVTRHAGVVELRLDRPGKKNAVTSAMYGVLVDGLASAAADRATRAVLFTASGETYCAGNDVGDFMAAAASGRTDALAAARFVEAIAAFPKVMVAAVHGPAVGIGATMLLHCDLVYASPTAKLMLPFVSLGLVPEAGSSLLLPRRVGHALAAEMILLGTPLDAARARDVGLVNAVVAAEELHAHALARATELAEKPPAALRLSRALLRGDRADVAARIAEEGRHFAACLAGGEAREAFTAFVQRRKPDFSAFDPTV
jgi:enoyl-CoA hydratase/carnithine racemase